MFVLWMASLQEGRRNIDLETKFLSVKKCYRRLIQRKLVFEKFFLEVNTTQHPKSYPEYRQPIHFQTTSAPSSIDMTRTTGFFQPRPSSKYPTTHYYYKCFQTGFQRIHVIVHGSSANLFENTCNISLSWDIWGKYLN